MIQLLADGFALDHVQKKLPIDDGVAARLCKAVYIRIVLKTMSSTSNACFFLHNLQKVAMQKRMQKGQALGYYS